MPQINRKSSLGHWYAPVFAPDFPRDPPEIHGCTLFERCKGCPYEYLYKPYEKLGGNGSAKRIMTEVDQLAIHKSTYNA